MRPAPGQAAADTQSARPAGVLTAPGPADPAAPGAPPEPPAPLWPLEPLWHFTAARGRRWLVLVWLLVLGIFLATDTGRMIFDTKLGVDIDAAGFYARLWPLWNPLDWLGTLQDQYIGYAIPMAPFFLAGQLLHLPVWVIERLWLSLLVAVGFWGIVRLARALNVGTDRSRLVAGAVFALWPTFTIVIGSTSAAALPGLLAPWAVLPLVAAARGRSPAALAAARSGVAIMAMAGVNAVSTLTALVLPALYILTHTRGRQRVSLCLWWGAAVLAATAWWLIPLVLQGRYSFNFLPYVEQAATTTGTASATAFLRGSSNWTAYFNLGTPWLPAGWEIVTSPLAVLASAVAAATGLAGLARRDMPERRWLLTSAGLVTLVALAGYWGPLGGPLHSPVDQLLDGALAPFRSVYKLEPAVAVVLALGCAHALARCWQRTVAIPGRRRRTAAGIVTAPVVGLILAGLALPYLTGQILQTGSFRQVPGYWYQVASYLAAHSPAQTALVVPADAHGQYDWGDPIDDPLESLASSPWAERALVPYGGAGSQVLLDTAETAIESGERVSGLASFLKRAGIRYVVVRNDLSPSALGYIPPQVVHATLSMSGFRRVAAFGPLITAAPPSSQVPWPPPRFQQYPAVEVFQAARPAARPDSPAVALPVSATVLVNGGPDSLLQLTGQRVLRAGQPAVVAGDPLAAAPSLWAVTDGQRRADNAFGLVNSNVSFTYAANENNPVDDPLGGAGQPPSQILPVPAAGHQTVAVLSGAAQVTASSFGSWLIQEPQADPANAFDGNPATSWVEGSAQTPVGQWIQITFSHPVTLPASIGVQLLSDSTSRSVANQLRVSTAAGSVTTTVAPVNSTQRLGDAPGPTKWLRITIVGASGVVAGNPGAGLRDVLIPGIRVTRYLQPAEDPAGQQAPSDVFSFQLQSPLVSGQASPVAGLPLARTFTTASTQQLAVKAVAQARPGPALEKLIGQLTPAGPAKGATGKGVKRAREAALRVSATSTWDSDPNFGPANLFAPTGRPWIAGSADSVLRLSWHGRRRISKLVLTPEPGLAAPQTVEVGSPVGLRLASIGAGGVVHVVPPLRTDVLYLTFPGEQQVAPVNPVTGLLSSPVFGLARLSVPALSGLRVAEPDPAARFTLRCGQGPAVSIDGLRYQSTVSGTISQLLRFGPLPVRLCTPQSAADLPAGRHWLLAPPSGAFTITGMSLAGQAGRVPVTPGTPVAATTDLRAAATADLRAAGSAAPATAPAAAPAAGAAPAPISAVAAASAGKPRALKVLSWQPDKLALRIGPGSESYVEIHENADPGWAATMNGRRLAPARLDGWQQAFVVPAGDGGRIELTFTPAAIYHAGIALSALAIIVLLAVAAGIGPWWRRRREPGLAGPDGADDGSPGRPARAPARPAGTGRLRRIRAAGAASPVTRQQASIALVVLVVLVAGGPVAIAVPVLAVIAWRWPRWLPAIAFGAMLTAGVLAASAAQPAAMGSGSFSGAAQACALIALAAALMPSSVGRSGRPQPRPGAS